MDKANYDVLVIGGGIAGVAAALETARSGLRTALVEKTILWGGLATSGLVPIYMPLCDGAGKQVTFGIAEELLRCSTKFGPGHIPAGWQDAAQQEPDRRLPELYPEGNLDRRLAVIFHPTSFVWALDELLEESAVEVWLDTLACTPIMQGDTVFGVEVENKSGRSVVTASCVVDASGDADIAFRAGAPCAEHGSYPSYLYQYTSLALARQAASTHSAKSLLMYRTAGTTEFEQGIQPGWRRYRATDGQDVTAFVMASRKVARQELASQQAADSDTSRENLYPAVFPSMAQFRMSRRIVGQETVRAEDRNRLCANAIGLAADCRTTRAVWEVPYGALVPQQVAGLLVAGRCVSAEGYAWHITRLIPAVALTGQVAGIAATLAVRNKTSPHLLDVRDVQQAARDKGFPLHLDDL